MSITNLFKIDHHSRLKRNVIELLYTNPNFKINKIFSLKASDDGDILCTNLWNKEYINYGNYITVAEYEGKFSKNAIYFPGNVYQKIIIKKNIFYKLNEFTISAWVKSCKPSINPMTLIEIIPKIFLENNITLNLDNYKLNNKSIEVEIFDDNNHFKLSKKHNEIEEYNKYRWNYATLTFKDDILYLFANGKLIEYQKIKKEIINSIDTDMYTVIGSSFLNNKSVSNFFYIDDFVIYDKALFTDDFNIPNTFIDPNINNIGLKTNTIRKIKSNICLNTTIRNIHITNNNKFNTIRNINFYNINNSNRNVEIDYELFYNTKRNIKNNILINNNTKRYIYNNIINYNKTKILPICINKYSDSYNTIRNVQINTISKFNTKLKSKYNATIHAFVFE